MRFITQWWNASRRCPELKPPASSARCRSATAKRLRSACPIARPLPPGRPYATHYNAVTPTYFDTVGMPLLEGRGIRPGDGPYAARVVVVSRLFAERYWPHRSAVDRQVLIPQHDVNSPGMPEKMVPASIIGVVGDVKQESIDEITLPQIYVPYAQDPFIFATLAVRTKGDPLAMTKQVQRAVWSVDPDQPMWKIRTLQSLVNRSARGGQRGMLVAGLTAFSGFALLLAAIGLYGVVAYTVGQRTAEFGIRMALGAAPGDVLKDVMRRGVGLAAAGLAAGVAVSLAVNRFLASELYQVRSTDPSVYAVVVGALLLIAIAAIASPARRAMRIDPAAALGHE